VAAAADDHYFSITPLLYYENPRTGSAAERAVTESVGACSVMVASLAVGRLAATQRVR